MEYRLRDAPGRWMGLINAQLKPMAAARLRCGSQRFRGPASSGNRLYKIIAIFQVEFVPKRIVRRQYLFGVNGPGSVAKSGGRTAAVQNLAELLCAKAARSVVDCG